MLPYYSIEPKDFEQLVRDIFNAKEDTSSYNIFGKSGQKQHGIDILSSEKNVAIQCKYFSNPQKLKQQELIEIIKSEIEKTKDVDNEIKYFIFATNYPHDAKIINFLRHYSYTIRYRDRSTIQDIMFIGWDEISKWTLRFPHIVEMYFSDFIIKPPKLELQRIDIPEGVTNWIKSPTDTNAYYHSKSHLSDLPIFDIIIGNNTDFTQIVDEISIFSEHLYSGLLGFPPIGAGYLKSLDMMKIELLLDGKWNKRKLEDPVYIPPKMPLRFKIELFEKIDGNICFFTGLRKIKFEIKFIDNNRVKSDDIFLNCTPTIPMIQTIIIQ
jgi:hypothetical protein